MKYKEKILCLLKDEPKEEGWTYVEMVNKILSETRLGGVFDSSNITRIRNSVSSTLIKLQKENLVIKLDEDCGGNYRYAVPKNRNNDRKQSRKI